MIEVSRLTYTPVTDYLHMPFRDFLTVREALSNILERERAAREEAQNQ